MARTRFDLPTPDDFTQAWWDAVGEGRLLLMRCSTCGRGALLPPALLPPLRRRHGVVGGGER